jgi:Rhs element Vgr protein
MTPASPAVDPTLLLFEIKAGGSKIDDTYQVLSIETWNAVNKVPRARIVLYDGSPSDSTFAVSSADTFLPGKTLDISVGYENQLTPIFSGIVIRHAIEISRQSASTLVVEAADKAIKMTVARKTAISENMTDSDIMSALLASYGLGSDIAATTTKHEAMVQFDATDWDTLITRAEMNGMVVSADAGKVTVRPPTVAMDPVLSLTYGDSILELRAEMDAVGQYPAKAVQSVAWDDVKQQIVKSETAKADLAEVGNVESATLAGALGVTTFPRVTAGRVVQQDLTAWSSAELLRSKLAKICGQVRFLGSAAVKATATIKLAGLGGRFNGRVFVGAVHHSIKNNTWFTTVDFGLPAGWHAQQRPTAFAPAAGHLPPIRGLQTGVVQKIHQDESGAFRVLVTLPLAQAQKGLWARLATFYASSDAGATFYPEVGDEVIVAFMNEDPRFAVVLGSVYSAKRKPPYPPDEKNTIKGVKTKAKLELTFDDDKKIVTLKTPGGHTFVMNDDKKSITVTDSQQNSVALSDKGIVIDSASNIEIKAKGNITLTAGGNLSMKATSNATCEGVQVELKAQAALSAQGTGSAELKSSGVVTVQGSLVKIN